MSKWHAVEISCTECPAVAEVVWLLTCNLQCSRGAADLEVAVRRIETETEADRKRCDAKTGLVCCLGSCQRR